jgi:hypothetical protein
MSIELEDDKNNGEHAPGVRHRLRDLDGEEENTEYIKQEEDEVAELMNVTARPKRHTQGPAPQASATKKYKLSSPSCTTRTTRSKTMNSRSKPDSIHSDTDTGTETETDSEPEHDSNPNHTTTKIANRNQKATNRDVDAKIPLINPSLALLRPYMAFQLSVSGLKGEAYKAAQASMTSVLDVAERLEQESSGTLAWAPHSLSSSSEEREMEMETRHGKGSARREDEDVLPRKQRELNEQTRKRLEQQRSSRRREAQRKDGNFVSHQ